MAGKTPGGPWALATPYITPPIDLPSKRRSGVRGEVGIGVGTRALFHLVSLPTAGGGYSLRPSRMTDDGNIDQKALFNGREGESRNRLALA